LTSASCQLGPAPPIQEPQEIPGGESERRQIRSWAKAIVRSDGADQTADIISAVSIGTFVPLPRVPKRNLSSAEPTAFTIIASRIAMNRSQYQITIGRKRLHQKARLRGTSMEAVRKNDNGLFGICLRPL
jgi:hypothetical protein